MSIGHFKDNLKHRGRNRKTRTKTFKTEATAKSWAESHNMKDYKIVDLKSNAKDNKFKIVQE